MLDRDTLADVEGDAGAIWSLAGAEPGDLSLASLSLTLLGTRPRLLPLRAPAALVVIAGHQQVVVRRGTPAARARWLVGHELAHWYYQRLGYTGCDLEARCDAVGAALVAPRMCVLAARRAVGDRPRELAAKLRTTQSLALLRVGEVTGEPVAVVRPAGALVRGDDWGWPELSYARAKRSRWPGVRKVRLDELPRVGLRVS